MPVAAEERAGGSALVASGDRDSFQLASSSTTILYPVRGGEVARVGPEEVRQGYGVDPKQIPDFIALRGDPSDKLPGASELGQSAPQNWCGDTGCLMASLTRVSSKVRQRCSVSIDSSPRWMQLRRCPRWPIRRPPGVQLRTSRAVGGSISWRTVWRTMHNLVIGNVAKGRKVRLRGSPREGPESSP
jgi:hypothetical protein